MTHPELFKLESLLQTKVTDNGYSASATVLKTNPMVSYSSSDIADFLRLRNITYGFSTEGLDKVVLALKQGPTGSEIIVARGKQKEEGVEGKEQYWFRTRLLAGSVNEQRIDFRERGLVNNVNAGQKIAMIIKEIPGKPGMKVDGSIEAAQPIRKIEVPDPGINVKAVAEGRTVTYIAEIAGHARKIFNELQVTSHFVITGDLDYTKGNIDFVGAVEILGSVKSGFKIKAGDDIMITGDVEPDAEIVSDRTITVKKTIRCGKKSGLISAGGDICAHTVLNSRLIAKGNVYLKELLSDSEVFCEGKFASSWGTIIGSEIEAIGGIVVNKIGKEDGITQNVVHAGKAISVEEKLNVINEEINNLNNEMALLVKKVTAEKEPSFTDEDFKDRGMQEQERIKRLGIARAKHAKQIKARLEELQKERQILLPRLKEDPGASIVVKGCIYPSCTLRIGEREINVLDEKKDACVLEYVSYDEQQCEKTNATSP